MIFSIRQIDHVVLYVGDQERSVRFYEDVLGCEVARASTIALPVDRGAVALQTQDWDLLGWDLLEQILP